MYSFTTDMQEEDIVFGGEKKLSRMIDEVDEIFHPRAITICATCPVGLIGDDIGAVARGEGAPRHPGPRLQLRRLQGRQPVGRPPHRQQQLMQNVVGKGTSGRPGSTINLLGEYNIGGDGWELERILKDAGTPVNCVLTGDSSYLDIRNLHLADLNLVQCHRSINYIAEMMETKYGTPWLKVNFIGVEATASPAGDGPCFGDAALIEQTEVVIAREGPGSPRSRPRYRKICEGKTALLCVGGSRPPLPVPAPRPGHGDDSAGYEFAHRDDYEGAR